MLIHHASATPITPLPTNTTNTSTIDAPTIPMLQEKVYRRNFTLE
jgi:hypothetical protein